MSGESNKGAAAMSGLRERTLERLKRETPNWTASMEYDAKWVMNAYETELALAIGAQENVSSDSPEGEKYDAREHGKRLAERMNNLTPDDLDWLCGTGDYAQ